MSKGGEGLSERGLRSRGGFTLLELMVVIALIGVLTTIAVPLMKAYLERARATTCLGNRYAAERAEAAFNLDRARESAGLDELVRAGFLAKEPQCPSGGVYAWVQKSPQPILACSIHYAAVAQPSENVLFSSSFDNMGGLKANSGDWALVDGALRSLGKKGEARLAFGDKAWTDYEIRTTATLTGGNGYGIYYRSDGKKDVTGYIFQYDPGFGNAFIVRKVIDGKEQYPIARAPMPAGFPVYGQSHQVSVAVKGDQHVITVDGTKVLEFKDSTFPSGMGGFRTWDNSEVYFDNLRVVQ